MEESPVSDSQEGSEEVADADEAIEGYMEGLVNLRPSAASEALRYAAPDSVAYAYLQHQINLAEAYLAGGLGLPESDLEAIDGGYEMCDTGQSTECNELTEFGMVDGLVTDLLVNGVSPGPRLALGDGSVVDSDGVSVEFLSSYKSIASEALFVVIEAETGENDAEMNIYSAMYRAPDGRQSQVSDAVGPFELGADSTVVIGMAFADAEPGGTVTVDGYVGDDYSDTIEFTLPTG